MKCSTCKGAGGKHSKECGCATSCFHAKHWFPCEDCNGTGEEMIISPTPGPWEVGADDRNGQIQILSEGGSLIAVVTHECVKPRGELEGNARRIAAAPEMFDALKLVGDWLISTGADGSPLPAVLKALQIAMDGR